MESEGDEDNGRGVRGIVSSVDWDDVVEVFIGSLFAGLVLLLMSGAKRRL